MALFTKSESTKSVDPVTQKQASTAASVKYPKPKILLLDLPASVSEGLRTKGFNVTIGTLGRPYVVPTASTYQPLVGDGNVPNHTEQEIIVVDLKFGELDRGPQRAKHRPDAELDLWGKCDKGFLDPRVRTAMELRASFDRIHSNGGVFIVFADKRTGISLQLGRFEAGRGLYGDQECVQDVWHFLAELSDMKVRADLGAEMRPAEGDTALIRLLAKYLHGASFTCTIEGGYRGGNEWEPLAVNKFGDAVALDRCRSDNGRAIILPQLADKAGFLNELFTTVLPELAPLLFPYIEQGKWTCWPEYELQRVLELKAKQAQIQIRAKQETQALETQIEEERKSNHWLHELIIATDAQLVKAVKIALATLGFQQVVDVDEERDREAKTRREDLQILDQTPVLIVDIKGLAGFPSDEDALQADKHAAIRMREWTRTDVVGLSLVNHQRHIPPLERENRMPFRQELLDAAVVSSLGLMTSWDLYRLVLNFQKHCWRSENVKPIFYGKGRIEAVPAHYAYIGTVAKAWTDKFGVVIENGELRLGDRLAVEFSIEFEEVLLESMQINKLNAQLAKKGDPVGLLWPTEKPKIREGLRVFRVQTNQ